MKKLSTRPAQDSSTGTDEEVSALEHVADAEESICHLEHVADALTPTIVGSTVGYDADCRKFAFH